MKIRSRRSIRRYKQERLPLEAISRAVDDARFAPSARNMQPWRFIVVHKPELVKEMNGVVRWLVWKDKAGKVHVPKKRLREVMSVDGYAF